MRNNPAHALIFNHTRKSANLYNLFDIFTLHYYLMYTYLIISHLRLLFLPDYDSTYNL